MRRGALLSANPVGAHASAKPDVCRHRTGRAVAADSMAHVARRERLLVAEHALRVPGA